MLLSDASTEERTLPAGADGFVVAVDKAPEEGLPPPYCLPIGRRPLAVLHESHRPATGEGMLIDLALELSGAGEKSMAVGNVAEVSSLARL